MLETKFTITGTVMTNAETATCVLRVERSDQPPFKNAINAMTISHDQAQAIYGQPVTFEGSCVAGIMNNPTGEPEMADAAIQRALEAFLKSLDDRIAHPLGVFNEPPPDQWRNADPPLPTYPAPPQHPSRG